AHDARFAEGAGGRPRQGDAGGGGGPADDRARGAARGRDRGRRARKGAGADRAAGALGRGRGGGGGRRGGPGFRGGGATGARGGVQQTIELEELHEDGTEGGGLGRALALIVRRWHWEEDGSEAVADEMAWLFELRDHLMLGWRPFDDRAEELNAYH